MLTNRNLKGGAILAIILDRFNNTPHYDNLVVDAYENGREHGYAIWNSSSNRKVAFSENRNSDQIVVYRGLLNDFNTGNASSAVIHKAAKYFDPYEYLEAATCAADYLVGI